jgi:hypothetical protein
MALPYAARGNTRFPHYANRTVCRRTRRVAGHGAAIGAARSHPGATRLGRASAILEGRCYPGSNCALQVVDEPSNRTRDGDLNGNGAQRMPDPEEAIGGRRGRARERTTNMNSISDARGSRNLRSAVATRRGQEACAVGAVFERERATERILVAQDTAPIVPRIIERPRRDVCSRCRRILLDRDRTQGICGHLRSCNFFAKRRRIPRGSATITWPASPS